MLVTPELWIPSCVITKTAAPVFASVCSFFETDVIRMARLDSRIFWHVCGTQRIRASN